MRSRRGAGSGSFAGAVNLACGRRDKSCKEAFAGHWESLEAFLQRCHLSDAAFPMLTFSPPTFPLKKIVEM